MLIYHQCWNCCRLSGLAIISIQPLFCTTNYCRLQRKSSPR